MPSQTIVTALIFVAALGAAVFFLTRGGSFSLPTGETEVFVEENLNKEDEVNISTSDVDTGDVDTDGDTGGGTGEDVATLRVSETKTGRGASVRQILITDNVKHSIPLNEILSGGPPKDGIPSIDDPKFISTNEADGFVDSDSVGLGFTHKGESRFYPYLILVWHELVNDTIQGDPVLVTYCPLCATGIVFDRRVNGETQEFGVSGKLWRSNLLMYNRAASEDDESLWSQVLGEAVLGINTGERLTVLRSDTVRYGEWKSEHPDTLVLSRDTGAARTYGRDPYGNYYTDTTVSFGATFNDDRLHPKTFVIGIEIDGNFKAYDIAALPVGSTTDTFAGETITLKKSPIDEIDVFIGTGGELRELETIDGFWFSWLAVHPETELFK